MDPYDDDDDDYDDRPIVFKRPRSEVPLAGPSTTNNVSPEPYLVLDPYDDDEDYREGWSDDDAYREDEEDRRRRGYESDEGSVDARNQGGGGDTVSNDSAGSLGTKSSMLGTFTDPDVLDCPICCDPLTVPVYQCENGHIECSSCCTKIGNKCPSCSLPIGFIRCRPIERILNSVKFACRNSEYGCKETVLHRKRGVHEKTCIFAPCYCPFENCGYVGSPKKLYAHFRGRHSRCALQFKYNCPFQYWLMSEDKIGILQEETDDTIFIINYTNNGVPRAINLIRIGVLDPKEEFYYELSVEHEDSKLKLRSFAATVPKWSASRPLKKYLLLPSDFVDPNGEIEVSVYIEKRRGS